MSYTQLKLKPEYREKLKVLADIQGRSMANMVEVLIDKAAEHPVMLRCTKPGCPRKLRIAWDPIFPDGTAEVRSLCAWHSEEGDVETYYDKDGNELDWKIPAQARISAQEGS